MYQPIIHDCDPTCPYNNCVWIFDQVRVRPTIAQGTFVEWIIHPLFEDPGPYTFQLEVGTTASNDSDDWRPVVDPVENVNYAVDPEQRGFGKTQWTHYRVKLTTPLGLYYSKPHHVWGDLHFRDLRKVNNYERCWRKGLRMTGGSEGYLLKQRLFGPRCENRCRDYVTDEIVNPQCPVCFGTGFTGGYFAPIPCVWVDMGREAHQDHLDDEGKRGTVNDISVPVKMLAVPQVYHGDIWVQRDSDQRWHIHDVKNLVEVRNVPVIIEAEMRLMPFTSDIYSIVIPDQFSDLPL